MALITHKGGTVFDTQPVWKTRRKPGNDRYSVAARAARKPTFDIYGAPPGLQGLQGLGDLAGSGTGIDFIDKNMLVLVTQVREAAFAAKITMYCSIAAGVGTLLLFFRTGRK